MKWPQVDQHIAIEMAKRGWATASCDSSDGLAQTLVDMCSAAEWNRAHSSSSTSLQSGLGFVINATTLPIHPAVLRLRGSSNMQEAYKDALFGGEEVSFLQEFRIPTSHE